MKAPDKIFLAESDKIKGEVLSCFASSIPFKRSKSIEYIRKDALLEWAKDWQNELDDSLGASMVHHVLNEVINKIESL